MGPEQLPFESGAYSSNFIRLGQTSQDALQNELQQKNMQVLLLSRSVIYCDLKSHISD